MIGSPSQPVPTPVPWFLSPPYPQSLPGQKVPILINDATWQSRAATSGQWFPHSRPQLEAPMSRAPRVRPVQ